VAFYGGKDIERAKLYKLFSSLFVQEPTDEILIEVKNVFDLKFTDTLFEIWMDFGYLFSGPEGHLPPYESLHHYPLGESPKLWGKATEEVQKFFQSVGLTIDEEIDLIPDHLSAELLFMSYLVENGLIERQKSFLEKHLLAWVPEYCSEIQRNAQTTFYRETAELLRELIVSDGEAFEIKGG
jgi:TorA maturation chaperone TorD